ncbi:metallophosphoesterase [Rufibacter roseus]|uniref:Metallophosphoesterase n=1 Tax=Rufibacter roseus TaxID=1567108 RepID=A0ABW2DLL1_9BACT|nr:metallophosphoesterase [Rufibacter roseus]
MNNKYFTWGAGALAFGAAAVLLDALFLEKYFFDLKTHHIGNLSSARKLKLVLLTDLHLKNRLYPYHKRLASKLKQLQPDLILIAGDTLDSSGKAAVADQFLGMLPHHVQKAAILGNHDYLAKDSLSALQKVYAQHNCRLLVNETAAFQVAGTRVVVTGLDDMLEGESRFSKAVEGVGKEEHHLLLIHSPLQQEKAIDTMKRLNQNRREAEKLNIRFVFAGHNHGGQVRLPGYVPVLPEKSGDYVEGWYNVEPPFLYLSKGFGTSRLPFRFGARSEVTLFHYHV